MESNTVIPGILRYGFEGRGLQCEPVVCSEYARPSPQQSIQPFNPMTWKFRVLEGHEVVVQLVGQGEGLRIIDVQPPSLEGGIKTHIYDSLEALLLQISPKFVEIFYEELSARLNAHIEDGKDTP